MTTTTTLTGVCTLADACATGLVAFDSETTGTDVDTARLVTVAVVVLTRPDPSVQFTRTDYHWLINPGVPIPDAAAAVHGITTEKAQAEGANPATAVGEVLEVLAAHQVAGLPVVGHNVVFDFTILDREARRHGHTSPAPSRVVDTYVLDKHADTYRRGPRTLTATAAHYGVTLDEAHEATADALAAARIAWAISSRYPDIGTADLDQLHQSQVEWKAQQSASLQDYLRRNDPTTVVNGDWPVQPLPHGWDPTAVTP